MDVNLQPAPYLLGCMSACLQSPSPLVSRSAVKEALAEIVLIFLLPASFMLSPLKGAENIRITNSEQEWEDKTDRL